MSTNPQAMAAMLASGLGGQQNQGGMQGQNSSPLGLAAQLAQKLMMMQSLQGQKPPMPQQPGLPPGAMQPQAPAALPMPGGVNA